VSHRPPRPMRVLIDANVIISSLLSPDPARSAAAAVMQGARDGAFVLVIPVETVEEVTRVAASKSWLTARISPLDLEKAVSDLREIVDVAPALAVPPPKLCRDRGDDYLIAQAVLAEASLLVTRDHDLLALGEIADVRIVDPVTFLDLLRSMKQ
jgi:putative PIN family toxin of toxin-antitoxin system